MGSDFQAALDLSIEKGVLTEEHFPSISDMLGDIERNDWTGLRTETGFRQTPPEGFTLVDTPVENAVLNDGLIDIGEVEKITEYLETDPTLNPPDIGWIVGLAFAGLAVLTCLGIWIHKYCGKKKAPITCSPNDMPLSAQYEMGRHAPECMGRRLMVDMPNAGAIREDSVQAVEVFMVIPFVIMIYVIYRNVFSTSKPKAVYIVKRSAVQH